MSDEQAKIEELLARHRAALDAYREWDQKIKLLLKGRRAKDLTPEDMQAYREIAKQRDAAYDEMRHLERALLDSVPGASTGPFRRLSKDDLDTREP